MLDYLYVFLVGGIICAIGQILLDKTPLTPARVLVLFVVLGVILTAVGIYDNIVEFGKAGATVPIIGFGYALAEGVKKAVMEKNIIGVFTGGITGTAAGITAAVFLGYIFALISKPGDKS
jgi:stage V sporulation protein AE